MRQLLADIGQARRMTTTVRFDSGTSVIDSKSQNDLAALVAQLERSDLQRKTIVLIGFSDVVGTPAKNATLALKRAQQVRTALLGVGAGRLDPRLVVARGYGALAPIACDDNDRGRQLNRRVELWVRDDATSVPTAPAVAR